MKTDMVTSLIRAVGNSDMPRFRQIAKMIISDEVAHGRKTTAKKLKKALSVGGNNLSIMPEKIKKFLHVLDPDKTLEDMVLLRGQVEVIQDLKKEYLQKELLLSCGLSPRNKILLMGSPGNGKTSLATVIASELNRPLYVVKYDQLIGSFLGETGSRLTQVFEFIKDRECVLFFDEFDIIARSRNGKDDQSEMKRVVNSLLLHLDQVSNALVVVASNLPESFDAAIWRRFDVLMQLNNPEKRQIKLLVRKLFDLSQLQYTDDDVFACVSALRDSSFSDVEMFCKSVIKHKLLNNDLTLGDVILWAEGNWDDRKELLSLFNTAGGDDGTQRIVF